MVGFVRTDQLYHVGGEYAEISDETVPNGAYSNNTGKAPEGAYDNNAGINREDTYDNKQQGEAVYDVYGLVCMHGSMCMRLAVCAHSHVRIDRVWLDEKKKQKERKSVVDPVCI